MLTKILCFCKTIVMEITNSYSVHVSFLVKQHKVLLGAVHEKIMKRFALFVN